jgi:hypothetical protein
MEYINRLDNFDGPDIAKIAASDANELYEEALTIYIKFGKKTKGEEQIEHHVAAVEVGVVCHMKHVTCITIIDTIIDTIILTNYTNDAYLYYLYTPIHLYTYIRIGVGGQDPGPGKGEGVQ